MSEDLKTLLNSIRLGGENRMSGEVWEESDTDIVKRLIATNKGYERILKTRKQTEHELEIRSAYSKWLKHKETLFAALCAARSLKFEHKVSAQVRIDGPTVTFVLHRLDSTSGQYTDATEHTIDMDELSPYLE